MLIFVNFSLQYINCLAIIVKRGAHGSKIKVIAPGDFLEITPSGVMVYSGLHGLQKRFWGWDVWAMESSQLM